MIHIDLAPVGKCELALLDELARGLNAATGVRCSLLPSGLDADFAFHPEREQYYSSEILSRMNFSVNLMPAERRLLGVTSVDLYIPILTFVFGEAQLGGSCAVVSTYRLRQDFYGLPPDPVLLRERLLKESLHEIGHMLALPHCEDYLCSMAPSHSVEWIDLKSPRFCRDCSARMESSGFLVRS
jgi:archaemetzincin